MDYEHDDMALAFKSIHAAAGSQEQNLNDPTRYLLMWKAARLHVRNISLPFVNITRHPKTSTRARLRPAPRPSRR